MPVLPKHVRPRWRYLAVVFETPIEADVSRSAFQERLWAAGRSLFGDTGSAVTDLTVTRFRFKDGIGEAVVRVRRGGATRGRAALATVTEVEDDPVGTAVTGVSGTIRACEENYLGIDRQPINHELVTYDGASSEAARRGEAVDVTADSTVIGATTYDLS